VHATDELPAVAAPGRALGRYVLGARLGAGGFGTVYAARDERLGRPVAVKVIPRDGRAPERAQREAHAVARLDHDAIVALFDAGEQDGCRYLVSELVEGRTLAQLEAAGDLSDRDVLRIGLALADALGHAHERGVIHRDVKPQNVIVPDTAGSRRAAAKLTDFGVAHLVGEEALTLTGDVVGTLAYMAPEQAAGRPVDERADLYSLGLLLYEALSGANPVRAGSPTATARRIGTVLPALARRRGDLPAELCAAVDRAILPDPELRGELDDLFDALADALPDVSDDGGLIAPHPLERRIPALPPAIGRLVAPAAAGALVWAALAGLTPEPAVGPPLAAAVAVVLVAGLPRTGWLVAAAATAIALALGPAPRPGAALERSDRARCARGVVDRPGRAADGARARLRRRSRHAGARELRRRARARGRRRDRAGVQVRRACVGPRLGRRGARAAVGRARPLADGRRHRHNGVGGRRSFLLRCVGGGARGPRRTARSTWGRPGRRRRRRSGARARPNVSRETRKRRGEALTAPPYFCDMRLGRSGSGSPVLLAAEGEEQVP